MNVNQVLLSPVVTEKSNGKHAEHIYTFKVHSHANKVEIAQAVHAVYGVTVESVRVMQVRPKGRLVGRGRLIQKRHAYRKALVKIDPKQMIDFNKLSKKS